MKGVEVTIGGVKVRVEPTAGGSPQRTESLARELVRGLLGGNSAPSLELVRGPGSGARRELPPPPASASTEPTVWTIGRGDDATWVILDEDLSREHVEIIRGWEGVMVRDLGSKNGTRIDGVRLSGVAPLRDGARIEVGNCELVFRDPAERHLHGELVEPPAPAPSAPASPSPRPAPRAVFWIASSLCVVATIGLVWVLAS